ncbi:MAG: hypothetical protein FJX23_03745 [Alphaproteobacteria bacterium]|nr:hypothetical protein [Alphaproteobacteria bacterium]
MKNALFIAAALLLATAAFFAGQKQSEEKAEAVKVATQLKPVLDQLGVSTMAITYFAYCSPPDAGLSTQEMIYVLQNNIALRDQLGGHIQNQNPEMAPESTAEFVLSAAFGLQRQTINALKEPGACTDLKWRKMDGYLKEFAKQDLQANVPEADKAIVTPETVQPILDSIKNS